LGIATDVGLDTSLAEGKARIRTGGRDVLLETALTADVALVHARRADIYGNLAYVATARNFNPLMAMAATLVLAEAEEVVPPGGLGPDEIHTPCPFVDAVAPIPQLHEEYAVVRR
jgi:acetate CoA/acetoacetate CoA-transferase alpha subunit